MEAKKPCELGIYVALYLARPAARKSKHDGEKRGEGFRVCPTRPFPTPGPKSRAVTPPLKHYVVAH